MSELRSRAESILADTGNADGVADALIATRDGLVALGDLQAGGDGDTVAAMAAASLAAAETVSLDVGAGPVQHLTATCNGRDVIICGLDDQYILVLISVAGQSATKALEHAQTELQSALAE